MFKVFTKTIVKKEGYSLWHRGISMTIEKDGVKITLKESEVIELVNSLPKTVGGKY